VHRVALSQGKEVVARAEQRADHRAGAEQRAQLARVRAVVLRLKVEGARSQREARSQQVGHAEDGLGGAEQAFFYWLRVAVGSHMR